MSHRSDRHEQWAIFWCSLLQPLICGEVPPEEAGEFLRELAATEQLFPNGQRKKPSRATLWRKWKLYREGGFEALLRKRRSDRGQPQPRHQPKNRHRPAKQEEQRLRALGNEVSAWDAASGPRRWLWRKIQNATRSFLITRAASSG